MDRSNIRPNNIKQVYAVLFFFFFSNLEALRLRKLLQTLPNKYLNLESIDKSKQFYSSFEMMK